MNVKPKQMANKIKLIFIEIARNSKLQLQTQYFVNGSHTRFPVDSSRIPVDTKPEQWFSSKYTKRNFSMNKAWTAARPESG